VLPLLPLNAAFAPFLRLMLSKSFPAVACFPDNNLGIHFVYYRHFCLHFQSHVLLQAHWPMLHPYSRKVKWLSTWNHCLYQRSLRMELFVSSFLVRALVKKGKLHPAKSKLHPSAMHSDHKLSMELRSSGSSEFLDQSNKYNLCFRNMFFARYYLSLIFELEAAF